MPIVWLLAAVQDAIHIRTYLAEEDPEAANKNANCLDQAISKLATMPSWGRQGRIFGTRELVISGTSYMVVYRVRNNRIEILRVLHGRQPFPDSL
jgi:toxin ParE1/3/4